MSLLPRLARQQQKLMPMLSRSSSSFFSSSPSFASSFALLRASKTRVGANFNPRFLSSSTKAEPEAAKGEPVKEEESTKSDGGSSGKGEESQGAFWWWKSAQFWGGAGAIAGWGMTGAAIYDASTAGPEIISLNMTGVMLVYSSLFARWAYIVKPQNLALCACHVSNVCAQTNQMRRAIEHKLANNELAQVKQMGINAGIFIGSTLGLIVAGPAIQSAVVGAGLGPVSTFAGAAAGPFTVHFWAPMSKWLISGASFLDLNRPTDKVSLPQYIALTATGLFFSRYALLVAPINYMLCSVNVALFSSSAWHLGRKVKADYIDK